MNDDRAVIIASESGISIGSSGDVSRALGACIGSKGLILSDNDLAPEFFDLHSGLAGELFQRFINYQILVAVVVADTDSYGEHRSHNMIRFVHSREEARA